MAGMHLLSLELQNVRGFSPSVRLALKPGYLLLKPPSPQPPLLGELLSALFFPDGRGGDGVFAVGGTRGSANLAVQANDASYRIERVLGGAGGLFRKGTGEEELVTEESQEMVSVLRAAGVPSRSLFDDCLVLGLDHLPSRRGFRKVSGAAAAAGADKLASLQKELHSAKELDELQTRVDSLTGEIYDIDHRLKKTDGILEQLEAARLAYEQAPSPQSLGLAPDIEDRVRRYPALIAKRDDALARLKGEQAQPKFQPFGPGADPESPSLLKNQAFWGGVFLGAAALGAGIALEGMGEYVALLDVPAFGFASFKALAFVDTLEARAFKAQKKGTAVNVEKKIRADFEQLAAPVVHAMQLLKVRDPEDILDVLAQRAQLKAKWEELEAQLRPVLEDPELAAARERRQVVTRELEVASAELTEKGAYCRTLREVQAELQKVKSAMITEQERAAQAAKAGAQAPLEDPTPAVLTFAADLFMTDLVSTGALLKDRCNQYLAALTDKRYGPIEFGKDGTATVKTGTQSLSVKTMPAADLDLYYIALRLTLVEKVSARLKLPFILDEPFTAVPPAKLQLLARMLKHLGTLTQVLHVTVNTGFASAADATVSL